MQKTKLQKRKQCKNYKICQKCKIYKNRKEKCQSFKEKNQTCKKPKNEKQTKYATPIKQAIHEKCKTQKTQKTCKNVNTLKIQKKSKIKQSKDPRNKKV